jgi:hypothetical protein
LPQHVTYHFRSLKVIIKLTCPRGWAARLAKRFRYIFVVIVIVVSSAGPAAVTQFSGDQPGTAVAIGAL